MVVMMTGRPDSYLDAGMSQPKAQCWQWNNHPSSLLVYQIPVWPFVVTFLSAVWCMINKSAGSLFFISVTSRHPQHSSSPLPAPCNAVTNINMWSRLQKQLRNGVPNLWLLTFSRHSIKQTKMGKMQIAAPGFIFKIKMCCAILCHF